MFVNQIEVNPICSPYFVSYFWCLVCNKNDRCEIYCMLISCVKSPYSLTEILKNVLLVVVIVSNYGPCLWPANEMEALVGGWPTVHHGGLALSVILKHKLWQAESFKLCTEIWLDQTWEPLKNSAPSYPRVVTCSV